MSLTRRTCNTFSVENHVTKVIDIIQKSDYCADVQTSFIRFFCLSGQKQHTHYLIEVTINYSFRKLATLTIDTLSLGLSTKTYTDVI